MEPGGGDHEGWVKEQVKYLLKNLLFQYTRGSDTYEYLVCLLAWTFDIFGLENLVVD